MRLRSVALASVFILWSAAVCGQTIARHEGSVSPLSEGWVASGARLGVTEGAVSDGGTQAWFIYDNSTVSGSILTYSVTPTDPDLAAVEEIGWRLGARLRVVGVSDTADYSVFVEFANGSRRYIMYFGTDWLGNPIVRLPKDSGYLEARLTGGSTYHLYELVYDPAEGNVVLLIDDVVKLTGYTGMSGTLKRVVWGGGQSNSTGKGHYNLVIFEAGYSAPDEDTDGVPDHADNCPAVSNPDQADTDRDGVGDACNDDIDQDGDEYADRVDVCPTIPNREDQTDTDWDGVGDACNDDIDQDGDEYADTVDVCPTIANREDQTDTDRDGVGDVCNDDIDPDGDEYADSVDVCPTIFDLDQTDTDRDGIGDACEAWFRILSLTRATPSVVAAQVSFDNSLNLAVSAELAVRTSRPPTGVTFTVNQVSCSSGFDFGFEYGFTLNGADLGSIILTEPDGPCAGFDVCAEVPGQIQRLEVTDATLLESAWEAEGENELRFSSFPRSAWSSAVFAWVRATVTYPDGGSEDVCLFDQDGGNCDVVNLCEAGYVSAWYQWGFRQLTACPQTHASASYAGSGWPHSLDISGAPDGRVNVVATTSVTPLTIRALRIVTLAAGATSWALNGQPAGSLPAQDLLTAGAQVLDVTDPQVLAAWNAGGMNTVSVVMPVIDSVAWARVEAVTDLGVTLRACLEADGWGDCTETSYEDAGPVETKLDASLALGDVPQVDRGSFEHAGEASLFINNQSPTASCQDAVVDLAPGVCSADVSVDNGSFDPDGDLLVVSQTPAGPYAIGSTVVTLTATDPAGASDACTATVTLRDAPVQCLPGANPGGGNTPNPNAGFYQVSGCSAGGLRLGDFDIRAGETIKLTQTPGGSGVRLVDVIGPERIKHFLVGPGDAVIVGTDGAGNPLTAVCPVPPSK